MARVSQAHSETSGKGFVNGKGKGLNLQPAEGLNLCSGLGTWVKGSDGEYLRAQFVIIRVGMKMEEQRN